MALAPIVLFAFNRLDSLQHTIASLLTNSEAKDSELFVFVDGPRAHKEGEAEKVKDVQDYVRGITGFKSVSYQFTERNRGLGPSIIEGVSHIVNQYGRVIVLEDDLILMPNFLSFINQGLEHYKDDSKIISICGHSCKVTTPQSYPYDAYLFTRSSSWGWGTWADRWNNVDWNLNDWEEVEQNKSAFKQSQGSDVYKMLKGWRDGKNKSWAIRFCYSQFVHRQFCIVPNRSLVNNNGFDGGGTNCHSYSRFKFELDDSTEEKTYSFPPSDTPNRSLLKQALWYHSLPLRLWSKLHYMLER